MRPLSVPTPSLSAPPVTKVPPRLSRTSTTATPHRPTITDRMVERVMMLTILELEEHLIPSQGAGDVLYVHAGDIVVTHDIRRTLEVFDGDMVEAIDSIRTFVVEGIIGAPRRNR